MKRQMEYPRDPKIIGFHDHNMFAVLMPVICSKDGPAVLFEVRASDVSQPGEICFPGGSLEPGETPEEGAVRETMEELLIQEEQIRLITSGDLFMHPGGLVVYPYLGILNGYEGSFSADEAAEVFTVPLDWILAREPEIYRTAVRMEPGEDFPYDRIPGGREYGWKAGRYEVMFYQYGDRTIWGMTARMLHSMAELLRSDPKLRRMICESAE